MIRNFILKKLRGGGLEDESIKTTKMSFLQNIIIFTILREIPGGNSTKSFPLMRNPICLYSVQRV